MPAVGLSLPGLVLMAGGLVLAYSGLNDPEGGPVQVVKDVLGGKTPTPGVQKKTATGFEAAGSAVGAAAGVAAASGSRAKILQVAKSYLGVKYVFGGMSRSGVDCSGLVAIAYRDGAGVSLPHKASAQASRGRRIDRSQILPGDLVAWGAPGNYPHIALALNGDQVIVAPHTGTVVQYQKLWEKKVPGFGYPDIYRILKD
jgi:cell wall-associated NlpC family hydrolase